jgi:hypothetical protein
MDINNNESILRQLKDKLPETDYNTLKDYLFDREADLFPETTKLISCPHEIIFTINANVVEENEEGETKGSKELCVRTYHIPVPTDVDYTEYMNSFFAFFEDLLLQTIDKTNQKDQQNG